MAKGFGLDVDDLDFMLTDNADHRRGFWRYYAAVPDSHAAALHASRLLSQSAL